MRNPTPEVLEKLLALFPSNQAAQTAIRKAANDDRQDEGSGQEGETEPE